MISRKSFQWKPRFCTQTDRHKDKYMTKLIVALRNFHERAEKAIPNIHTQSHTQHPFDGVVSPHLL